MKYIVAFFFALAAAGLGYVIMHYPLTMPATATDTHTVPKTTTKNPTSGTKTVTTPTGVVALPASVTAIAANTFAVNFPLGPAPLGVTFSSSQGWGMTVDFGDGQKAVFPKCSGACDASPATTNHIYTKAGTYKASLIDTSANPDQTLSFLTITVR